MIHSLNTQRKRNKQVQPRPGYLDPVRGADVPPEMMCITRKMTPEDWAWVGEQRQRRASKFAWATDKAIRDAWLERAKARTT